MELAKALDVRRGVTAIIGAGGKTTLLLALARELAQSARVIITTTTHIYPQPGLPCLLCPGEANIKQALTEQPCLCVGNPAKKGKLTAADVPPGTLAELADYVLVEADGAHGRPAKAHADYEPAVPAEANQTILVFGLSALGRPIRESVHRPALFAARCGCREEELLTPELTAGFINAETPHTRVLLNQADTPERAVLGREMAKFLRGPVCLAALEKEWITCLS